MGRNLYKAEVIKGYVVIVIALPTSTIIIKESSIRPCIFSAAQAFSCGARSLPTLSSMIKKAVIFLSISSVQSESICVAYIVQMPLSCGNTSLLSSSKTELLPLD